jgi:hypothetical protein
MAAEDDRVSEEKLSDSYSLITRLASRGSGIAIEVLSSEGAGFVALPILIGR